MKFTCAVLTCRYPATVKKPLCPKHEREERQAARVVNVPDPVSSAPIDIHSSRVRTATAFKRGGLYVILFDTGMIKIGYSAKPGQRVVEHRKRAWNYGVSVVSSWSGRVREDILPCEAALANALAPLATEERAREYFRGVDFNHAVDQAKQAYQDHQPR